MVVVQWKWCGWEALVSARFLECVVAYFDLLKGAVPWSLGRQSRGAGSRVFGYDFLVKLSLVWFGKVVAGTPFGQAKVSTNVDGLREEGRTEVVFWWWCR